MGGLLSFPFCIQAQIEIGIGVGMSRNKLAIINRTERLFTSYRPVNGIAAELIFKYPLHKYISVRIEPSFVGKNYSLVRSGYYQGVFQTTYNSYLQFPIIFTGSVDYHQFSVGISAGGYSSYWARSTRQGVLPNLSNLSLQDDGYTNVFQDMQPYSYKEDYQLAANMHRRWEFGWLIGTDFQYKVAKQLTVFVAPRYSYALTGQVQNPHIGQEQRYNETLTIFAGLLFKIKSISTKNEK